ncbi:MAG: hypothetical protein ABEJ65_02000, partial [bacterium]
MIGHLRIEEFIARVFQKNRDLEGEPVAVRDEARILSASPEAKKQGITTGKLVSDLEE